MNTTRRSFIGSVAALLLPWRGRKPVAQAARAARYLKFIEAGEEVAAGNPLFSGGYGAWSGSVVAPWAKFSRLPAAGDQRRPLA